jgi:carbon storage regulator
MLVLSRRIGEEIVIADDIRVTVLSVTGTQVRLGITAPRSVPVTRAELLVRLRQYCPQLNEADGNHIR